MNKKQKKKLKSEIAHEVYVEENNELIFKKLIFNPLLRIMGMLILLIFSVVNHSRIVRLAALTSNAIFSSEHILGHITYYTLLGITIGICLIVSLTALILKSTAKEADIILLRKAYQIYTVYDFMVFILSTFVCLFFIIMILITPCSISGDSMQNTYSDGDRVLLWNIGYSPVDGDVIVFDSANYTDTLSRESRFYIKRIVAKEDDTISYNPLSLFSGEISVNGKYVETISRQSYNQILRSIGKDYLLSFTVPKDKLLVFGDNRSVSHDSRAFGFIDEKDIIGKVLFRFYPFTKIGNPDPD
ncbi:MAG: signal peptidase I [Anaeroplasmataceae bacterium]|nr:signal peptidase I [Anaeroplasmataceae bacterium]